jgi:O-antigen/teichoic acid export membrane protein
MMLLLLPNAFSLATYPAFSKMYVHARGDLQRFYQVCYKYLLVVGFPLGLGTMLVGDRVIMLVYGREFAGSATAIRILAVFLFTIVGYSNGPLLNAVGMQRFFAWSQGLAVGATGILSLLLAPIWGPTGAAVALVLPGIATFFVHSIASHRQVGLSLPWLVMGKALLATLFMGLSASVSLGAGVPLLVVVIVVAPSTYGLSILLLGIPKKEELRILAGAGVSRAC